MRKPPNYTKIYQIQKKEKPIHEPLRKRLSPIAMFGLGVLATALVVTDCNYHDKLRQERTLQEQQEPTLTSPTSQSYPTSGITSH